VQQANADPKRRLVLEAVPKVTFFKGGKTPPQDDPFPACMAAIHQYLAEFPPSFVLPENNPWHAVHVWYMGITGTGFRSAWQPPRGGLGASCVFNISEDPMEPLRRGFNAAGWRTKLLPRPSLVPSLGLEQTSDTSREEMLAAIRDSLERGLPVVALGVVGPPEPGLITGYDDGGDTLIGWSFFQDHCADDPTVSFEPNGMYRKRDWYGTTLGVMPITERGPAPSARESAIDALRFGLKVMGTQQVRGLPTGQAALEAWGGCLKDPDQHSLDRPEELRQAHEAHWFSVGRLAEARAWCGGFLDRVSGTIPELDAPLSDAAGCCYDIHDICWAIWQFTVEDRWPHRSDARFADPGTRCRMEALLRICQKLDGIAAGGLERALETAK
jgi:hypothetical protein